MTYGLSLIKEYRGMPALALAFEKSAMTAHKKSGPYIIINYCSTTQQNG